MSDHDVLAIGGRIEALVRELGDLPDTRARETAEELVRQLMELYGAGLTRIVELLAKEGDVGPAIRERLMQDDLVASLLILHGLHPSSLETRVSRALDRLDPHLSSLGARVMLIDASEDVVRTRLEWSPGSRSASHVMIKLAVERAIGEAAPEVARVHIEGLSLAPEPPLLQIIRSGARPETEVRS